MEILLPLIGRALLACLVSRAFSRPYVPPPAPDPQEIQRRRDACRRLAVLTRIADARARLRAQNA